MSTSEPQRRWISPYFSSASLTASIFCLEALGREAVGDPQALGVVAEDEVLVAEGDGGLGHALYGPLAVGVVRVDVQVAPDVRDLDEVRELALLGGLDLPGVLPELRRDVRRGRAASRAPPRWRRARSRRCPAPRGRTRRCLSPSSRPARAATMLWAWPPGEVVQQGAEGLGLDDPQVHLDPVASR